MDLDASLTMFFLLLLQLHGRQNKFDQILPMKTCLLETEKKTRTGTTYL